MIDTWAGSGPRSRHVPGKWPAAALYVLLTLLLTYPLSLKPDRTVLAHYPDDELLMWSSPGSRKACARLTHS